MAPETSTRVTPELAGKTLGAAVKSLTGVSWAQARRLILGRHVRVDASPCLDDARRLRAGELVEVLARPLPPVPREQDVRVLYADADLIVVDKPAGVMTLRRGEERDWSESRKDRQPTLDELVRRKLPALPQGTSRADLPRIRPVHRLDRDTSGLMLFALSERAEHALIRFFAKHQIERIYRGVAHGPLQPRTIESWLIRDRGDGLRGSTSDGLPRADAQRAVTHIRPVERLGDAYTMIECRLETGRTHQIRIHLAEIGHMLCGEKLYTRAAPGSAPVEDRSGAPRQALHSAELRFVHPVTDAAMEFRSALPRDLAAWLGQLRGNKRG